MICKHNCAMLCKYKYVTYCLVGFYAVYRYLIIPGYIITHGNNWVDKRNIYGIIELTLYSTGEKYGRSKIKGTSLKTAEE